jgi:hypothetical protein
MLDCSLAGSKPVGITDHGCHTQKIGCQLKWFIACL